MHFVLAHASEAAHDESLVVNAVTKRRAGKYGDSKNAGALREETVERSGPVEFVTLQDAKMFDSRGKVCWEQQEITVCPNVLTQIALDEGPRGRDIKHG